MAHAPSPNEIAFSGDRGEISSNAWIGFGGEMEPENASENEISSLKELWERICRSHVEKSYKDYMKNITR